MRRIHLATVGSCICWHWDKGETRLEEMESEKKLKILEMEARRNREFRRKGARAKGCLALYLSTSSSQLGNLLTYMAQRGANYACCEQPSARPARLFFGRNILNRAPSPCKYMEIRVKSCLASRDTRRNEIVQRIFGNIFRNKRTFDDSRRAND